MRPTPTTPQSGSETARYVLTPTHLLMNRITSLTGKRQAIWLSRKVKVLASTEVRSTTAGKRSVD